MNKSIFSITSLMLLVAACVFGGYQMGLNNQGLDQPKTADAKTENQQLNEMILKADTAASGKKIAVATGSIDGNIDVIFTLDYESGNLFAWLPSPNGFIGQWTVNVAKAVGLEKGSNPDLVLAVGNYNVRGGNSGAIRDVPLICYVANGENGQVAGFGFQWNSQMAKNGTNQQGALIPVYQGSTREQTLKRQ